VTAQWLTSALRSGGTIGDATTVADVTADPADVGVGFVGEVGKLAVTYDGPSDGAPSTMVIKFPTASADIKAMMRPTRIYEREHRFYAELADQTPVTTPSVYHVTCETSDDPEVDETYVLIMEDLSSHQMGDQVAGLSADQTASALTGLAAHHARFWNGAGMEAAPFIPVINGPLNQAGQAIYEASLPGFKQVFADALQPEMVPVADGYTAKQPEFLDRLAAMPHTLVHFDFRADNLFFDRSSGEVLVIDWQAISQGGGAADVGYLLSQNLESAVRREHENDLLRTYHDGLVAGGVTGYDFDQFFADYQMGIMYGWIIPVFAVGSLDASSERAMALWTSVVERAQDAIFQHNAQRFVLG
jgi:hypothetical protein